MNRIKILTFFVLSHLVMKQNQATFMQTNTQPDNQTQQPTFKLNMNTKIKRLKQRT